jgi:hypothetical protein
VLATERVPQRLRPVVRDAGNRLRYGADAPRYAERIWVRPAELHERVLGSRRLWSGQVRDGDWDRHREPVGSMPKVQACIDRWVHGHRWEDTGAYTWMMRLIEDRGRAKDGCETYEDVVARYAQLDRVFEQVRAEGRLRRRSEVDPPGFRELGGVLVNVDRDGAPVAGGGGWHRLAMARILELPLIPAQVGLVHRAALPGWRRRFTRVGVFV